MSDFAMGWLSGCVAITVVRLACDLFFDYIRERRAKIGEQT